MRAAFQSPIIRIAALILGCVFLTCGALVVATVVRSSPPVIQTQEVTRVVEVTRVETQIVEVTRVKLVTVTYTNTPRLTATPSLTPSITPIPSRTPRPTRTPLPTPSPRPTKFEQAFAVIDVRDLDKNPDRFKDQKIQLAGQVFNIDESGGATFFQMWVRYPGGSSYDRVAVAVNYFASLPNVFEDTRVIVFGLGDGVLEGTNAYGGSIVQPKIFALEVRVQ